MATYATLQELKDHLRITTNTEDSDLYIKLEQAEAIVLDYVKGTPATTATRLVQAAVLLQAAELYRFRGDDPIGPQHADGQLSPVVTNILRRLRDPALA